MKAMNPGNIQHSTAEARPAINAQRPRVLERRAPPRLEGGDFETSHAGGRHSVRGPWPESQRDSVAKPRVARNELPWVTVAKVLASTPLSHWRKFSFLRWRTARAKAAVNAPHSRRFAKTGRGFRGRVAARLERRAPPRIVSSVWIIIACALTFAGWNVLGLGNRASVWCGDPPPLSHAPQTPTAARGDESRNEPCQRPVLQYDKLFTNL